MSSPVEITDQAAARRITIRDTWDRFEGHHPASLIMDEDGVDDNVALNDLATIAETGVDFLMGSGGGQLEFSVLRGGDQDDAATELLTAAWDAVKVRTLLRKLAMSGAIAGHVVVKLVPREDGTVRIINLDAEQVSWTNAPDDIDTRIQYAIDTPVESEWGTVVGRRREQHTRSDDGSHWIVEWLVTDTPIELSGMRRAEWVPDPLRPDEEVWPHAFPAIVDWQNLPMPHRDWGRPDLSDDVLALQEAINRTASNEQKTLRHFAHPQLWAEGENPEKLQGFLDASIGAVICLPSGSKLNVLNLQHEGLAAAASFRESLTEKLFEVSRVPRIAAGKVDGIGSLSGVALLILYRPLVAKSETKRDLYGDGLTEISLRLLVLLGVAKALDDVAVALTWPDVLPKDMASEVLIARDLKDLGVSLRTVLGRLGIDWEQERDRVADEANDPTGDAHGLLGRIEELQALVDAANGVEPVVAPTADEVAS